MLKVFSVHDSKSESYSVPLFARTVGEAERMFTEDVRSPNSFMGKYPADFTLYAIGEYDQVTGSMVPYPKNNHLMSASHALEGSLSKTEQE